jgi:hypothetical protein
MLATLYNLFNDQRGLDQFAFANADLHVRQNAAIAARGGPNLSAYILDPIVLGKNLETWLSVHQETHNQVNQVLGIRGNDLSDVDFSNPQQLASWIWLHAQEHVQASDRLGLT